MGMGSWDMSMVSALTVYVQVSYAIVQISVTDLFQFLHRILVATQQEFSAMNILLLILILYLFFFPLSFNCLARLRPLSSWDLHGQGPCHALLNDTNKYQNQSL